MVVFVVVAVVDVEVAVAVVVVSVSCSGLDPSVGECGMGMDGIGFDVGVGL